MGMVKMMSMKRLVDEVKPVLIPIVCFAASPFQPWGKPGSVVLACLGISWLLWMVIHAFRTKTKNMSQQRNLDSHLAYLNKKRHDLFNHIQVMTGLLSLKKYDHLKMYIQRIKAEAERESHVARLGYPPLSSYFLTHSVVATDIVFDVYVMENVSVTNAEQGKRLLETVLELEHFLRMTCTLTEEEQMRVNITLASFQHDIMIYVDLPEDSHMNTRLKNADWTSLRRKISACRGEMFVEPEEPLRECAVRIS